MPDAKNAERMSDIELLAQMRIDLSRRRYNAPAVTEFSRRVRTYYQAGESVAAMSGHFGLEGPSAKGQMHYWVTKARINLDEPVGCAA
jgi:hypothetical protein